MTVAAVQVTVELGHRAWYRKKPAPSKTHDWVLYVKGSDGNDISHFVEKIVYNLHESFTPPRRVKEKPPYELHESGYGEFYTMIDIYFKNKGEKGVQRKVSLQYFLNLNHKDAPPINSSRFEKINFHHPSEEFLDKVLKAGGVILNEDGMPTNQKSRSSISNSNHDPRPIDPLGSDSDLVTKPLSHKSRKLKRSSEVNPMSNESASSSDSLISRHSSKSDGSERDAEVLSLKRKYEAMLFSGSEEDVPKKKKKAPEKPDPGKTKTASESKPSVKSDATVEKKHRSGAEDGVRHSSGKGHRESGSTDHHDSHKSQSGSSGNKQKSSGSSSRSSSRTPQETPTPTKNPDKVKSSESRSHGNSSHRTVSGSGHSNSSSSSSNVTGNSKSNGSKSGGSHHGDQSQRGDSHHRSSSKQRDPGKKSDGTAKKLTGISSDVHVRLSPMDAKFSSSEMNSRTSGTYKSAGKFESGGDKTIHSQDTFSNGKPTQMSPVKHPPKTVPISSSTNSSDFASKGSDGVNQGTVVDSTQNRPKYDELLNDMRSDEDEEEDGEIRSPKVAESFDTGIWKKSSDKKSSKHKDGVTSERRKSSKSSSSHLEKVTPESFKSSPKKPKSEHSSSHKMSVATVAEKGNRTTQQATATHGKVAKKPSSKENSITDSNSSALSKITDQRSQDPKDSSERKLEVASKLKPPRTEITRVPSIDVSSVPPGGIDCKDDVFDDVLSDPSIDKTTNERSKKEGPKILAYSDRAPNGELLTSLVMIKQRLSDMTDIHLLTQIADVIEASGKFKIDEENFEFDLCDLDADTVGKVKELMENE